MTAEELIADLAGKLINNSPAMAAVGIAWWRQRAAQKKETAERQRIDAERLKTLKEISENTDGTLTALRNEISLWRDAAERGAVSEADKRRIDAHTEANRTALEIAKEHPAPPRPAS